MHSPAAMRALPKAAFMFSSRLWPGIQVARRELIGSDELPAQRKQRGPVARAEDAEVADTHKASRQHVQQEAPEKLVHGKAH